MAINNASDPAKTYTLDQFISMRYSDDMTYYNFSIIQMINDIQYLDHNLIDDYIEELNKICSDYFELDPEQYKKYKYSPDFLAYDVYGSTQLDFIILRANGMIDPKEFNLKKIRLPYKSKLLEFLNRIYNANSGYIAQNRSDNNINSYL